MKIVEEKDATSAEKAITEINTDVMRLILSNWRQRWTSSAENAQKEYYFTDCPRLSPDAGQTVAALNCSMHQPLGVNTRVISRMPPGTFSMQGAGQADGARRDDEVPEQTVIEPQVEIGLDTVIKLFTSITGLKIRADCVIGPHAVLEGPLDIPAGTTIGPFVHQQG
ncbi:MAG: hypothetical protein U0872_08030 [Planctomycetaceae bacterium]